MENLIKELILTDHLAIDRTHLANERTFLSYMRTALTCLIAGISLNKLFPQDTQLQYLAWFLIGIAPIIAGFGIVLSWRMRRKIKAYYQK